jgi:hypothetical protein
LTAYECGQGAEEQLLKPAAAAMCKARPFARVWADDGEYGVSLWRLCQDVDKFSMIVRIRTISQVLSRDWQRLAGGVPRCPAFLKVRIHQIPTTERNAGKSETGRFTRRADAHFFGSAASCAHERSQY